MNITIAPIKFNNKYTETQMACKSQVEFGFSLCSGLRRKDIFVPSKTENSFVLFLKERGEKSKLGKSKDFNASLKKLSQNIDKVTKPFVNKLEKELKSDCTFDAEMMAFRSSVLAENYKTKPESRILMDEIFDSKMFDMKNFERIFNSDYKGTPEQREIIKCMFEANKNGHKLNGLAFCYTEECVNNRNLDMIKNLLNIKYKNSSDGYVYDKNFVNITRDIKNKMS